MIKALLISLLLLPGIATDNPLQEQATREHKNIVVYFSGSDWCSICHQFKARVLNAPAVDSLLQQKYVYYVADFPQRKKLEASIKERNEGLADKLNKNGVFPLLVVADEHLTVQAILPGNADLKTATTVLKSHVK